MSAYSKIGVRRLLLDMENFVRKSKYNLSDLDTHLENMILDRNNVSLKCPKFECGSDLDIQLKEIVEYNEENFEAPPVADYKIIWDSESDLRVELLPFGESGWATYNVSFEIGSSKREDMIINVGVKK